ncbi:MAG: PAS domain-containing protein [Pseudomonadota bacterium]
MLNNAIHPNTKAMLQAWRRMGLDGSELASGPPAQEFPGLLGRLFVLTCQPDGSAAFRVSGAKLPILLGRDMTNAAFEELWTGPDRAVAAAIVRAIVLESSPAMIRARAETAFGDGTELEITLAPLARGPKTTARVLGLYQSIRVAHPQPRPLVSHRINAVVMPEPKRPRERLKLVSAHA